MEPGSSWWYMLERQETTGGGFQTGYKEKLLHSKDSEAVDWIYKKGFPVSVFRGFQDQRATQFLLLLAAL